MKYIYVYPVEKFERNEDNETIVRAWKEGEAKRYKPEEFAELINDDRFCDESNWVRVIDDDESYFEITSLHREDLECIGYETNGVDDSVMKKLASKLGDNYCEHLFWSSLPIFADSLGIPMKEEEDSKSVA